MNSHTLYLILRDSFVNKHIGDFSFTVTLNKEGNVVLTAIAYYQTHTPYSEITYTSYNDVYYKNKDLMDAIHDIFCNTYEKYQQYAIEYGMFDEKLANALTQATGYYDSFFNNFPVKFFIEFGVNNE